MALPPPPLYFAAERFLLLGREQGEPPLDSLLRLAAKHVVAVPANAVQSIPLLRGELHLLLELGIGQHSRAASGGTRSP